MNVLIIGAGFAGCCAALKLRAQFGVDVTLLEQDPVPGGMLKTLLTTEGIPYEYGPRVVSVFRAHLTCFHSCAATSNSRSGMFTRARACGPITRSFLFRSMPTAWRGFRAVTKYGSSWPRYARATSPQANPICANTWRLRSARC